MNILNKKKLSFSEQLLNVKNIFKESYEQAMNLNKDIEEDIIIKQNEIESIKNQIELNIQITEDNNRFISKLRDLIS